MLYIILHINKSVDLLIDLNSGISSRVMVKHFLSFGTGNILSSHVQLLPLSSDPVSESFPVNPGNPMSFCAI